MERIQAAPEDLVRAVLVALCSDHATKIRAMEHLNKLEAARVKQRPVASPTTDSSNDTKKRKAADPSLHICVQCREPYTEAENSSSACQFHDGNLDVNYEADVWADHDEDCHGTIDTEENREEYPEGFVWDCCDKLGFLEGCTRGWHKAVNTKRGKYADGPGTDMY